MTSPGWAQAQAIVTLLKASDCGKIVWLTMSGGTGLSMSDRILLVDDDDGFRYAAAKALGGAGFLVEDAGNYRAALEILDDKKPLSLLITDLVMPRGVNGFALARMARMRHHNLKVLYFTAYDVPTHEAVGKVLRKPVTPEQLIEEARLALAN